MLPSDHCKIIISFVFGILLSPFSWGIFYLLLSIVIFFLIDYVFCNGKFEYSYLEHRASVIFYSVLGFIIGRTIHRVTIMPTDELHKCKPIKDITYDFHETLLLRDLQFISEIEKDVLINVTDRYKLRITDTYYFLYKLIMFNHRNDIYSFIDNTIGNSIALYKIKRHENIKELLVKSEEGLNNLMYTYKDDKVFCDKIKKVIDSIGIIN